MGAVLLSVPGLVMLVTKTNSYKNESCQFYQDHVRLENPLSLFAPSTYRGCFNQTHNVVVKSNSLKCVPSPFSELLINAGVSCEKRMKQLSF